MSETATLERARTAMQEHAWADAFERLSSLDADRALRAEDLELLGEAAWWSAHPNESRDAFERAYAAYLEDGNPRRAAYVALRLANDYVESRDLAQWNGWVRRAATLLEAEPETVEHGYLALELFRGVALFGRGTIEDAKRHADRVVEIGMRFGDRDLQAYGVAFQGWLLLMQARIQEGLSMVDEAAVSAVAGELTPYAAGGIYCLTIGACRSVADYRRAGEWTEAAMRWCERQSVPGFPGVCGVHRAEILRLRGAFSDAETEARQALESLMAFGMLNSAGWGHNEIGEIRLRLGDLEGAEEAFERAHQLGQEPQPGLARLHLARGNVDAARASIATALAEEHDPPTRARLLPTMVEVSLATHDETEARQAVEELRSIAAAIDMPMLHALAHQALGATLIYEEDAPAAVAELRSAVRHWTQTDAPFETAEARRWLAVAHRAGGDEASALLELRSAKAAFDRLGAALEAERTEAMIRGGADHDAGRRVVRTFMFTDIVGSTNLLETMGDAAWHNVLRWHDETLGSLIGSHGGEVVRTTGDGFFATFDDAATAASCAIAIQRRLAEHRRAHGFAPQVRIGLHSAEATAVVGDYVGLGVHEAARVGALAGAGEILATVPTLPAEGSTFETTDEREVSLKGIAQPVRVASVGWER
jgi:class 3 adenylate cyclase